MRIVIDPGHGGHDSGADGPSGLHEAPVALELAIGVRNILVGYGIEVKLTRETDVFIELYARCDIANNWNADYFVSIHLNSDGPNAVGIETIYVSERGEQLAQAIQLALVRDTGDVDRGLKYRSDLAVLNGTNMPAALVECGFISNLETEMLFTTEHYRATVSHAIAEGIMNFLATAP